MSYMTVVTDMFRVDLLLHFYTHGLLTFVMVSVSKDAKISS